MLEFALFLCFPAAMAYAASMDLLTMTIPNRISLALIAAFAVAFPLSGIGLTGIAGHVGAGALMLVVGIVMFSQGWLGGGDAKLLAAASLWLGFEHLLGYLIGVVIAGGVLVVCLLYYRQIAMPLCLVGQKWAVRLHGKREGIPYGLAIAAGGLWIYPSSAWLSLAI